MSGFNLGTEFVLGSTGMVFETAALQAPAGFLFCYGQAISRTTYARLFSVITLPLTATTTSGNAMLTAASVDITGFGLTGAKVEGTGVTAGTTVLGATSTTITLSANATASGTVTITLLPYGAGDGSTTFNIPDYRGRAGSGRDNMGGTAASVLNVNTTGTTTAASAVVTAIPSTAGLSVGMSAYGSTLPAGVTIASIDSGTQVTLSTGTGVTAGTSTAIRFGIVDGATMGAVGGSQTHTMVAGQMPSHSHTQIATQSPSAGASGNPMMSNSSSGTGNAGVTQNTGGGNAHPNVQPTIIMNRIIKT